MLNKIVNCYNIEKNFKYSTVIVRSVSILHVSEHFQLIFDNPDVNNDKKINQKMANFFSAKLFRTIQFVFLILLRKVTLESKVAPANHKCSAFLFRTNKTFYNVELFSIFSQTFLELIFATKMKTMLFKESSVLFTSCQKNIAYITCLNT